MDLIDLLILAVLGVIGIFIYFKNKKDREKAIKEVKDYEPEPLIVEDLEGYQVAQVGFAYGPPSIQQKKLIGPFTGLNGEYLSGEYIFVPQKAESFPQGDQIWGAPAVAIGVLYEKKVD